jgi:hypothetical protein
MPGEGSGRPAKWKGGAVKEYDRRNPDPGRKAGIPSINEGDSFRRKGGGYGNLDDGSGRGFGVKNFGAGREARSKNMDENTGTPVSVLNTGESKFVSLGSQDPEPGDTGDMDAGYGTGIGHKGRP